MGFIFPLIFTSRISGKYLGIFFTYLTDGPSKYGILGIEARALLDVCRTDSHRK